ncbi:kinase-like protein [Epithele typhae]|uniref:kinase-like protein n=1 Tax=Epithele typhae TaxID=378194 RepID=UPI002008C940|nr:kinase-like protein [Epithele typhae]KAH9927080.1 kinase-like protein [Epithele typhae]
MAATALFSCHSSNPFENTLESPSAGAHGCPPLFHRHMDIDLAQQFSDDGPSETTLPQLEQYHSHLAQLFPDANIPTYNYGASSSKNTLEKMPTNLSVEESVDDEMLSDDDEEDEEMVDPGDELEVDLDDDDDEEEEDEGDTTDEESSILLKPRSEQAEILEEIVDLENAVPDLAEDYKLLDRLGTGTFSAVYKALDLGYHTRWHNREWHGRHPPNSSAHYQSASHPRDQKVYVAVKRIYVTSGPERIRNEISIMEDCRGSRHVSQIITAFRHQDQVVVIMPYQRNADFRDYYKYMPLASVKCYFRCMFRALRDIHSRGIIHRDVKPANFLYDPRTGIGTLCDFGLACRIERGQSHGACLHTPPTRDFPHGRLKPRVDLNVDRIKKMQRDARLKSASPSDKIGYPAKDARPRSKANRAGTRGFRAPEVLLKCGDQTGAIDVWSAGMILLFFLTKKFPLFQSNDDTEALMEIAVVIGKKRMEKTATLHSRVFQSNVPSLSQEGTTWRQLVENLNPNIRVPAVHDPYFFPPPPPSRANSHPPSSSSAYSRSSSAGPERYSSPSPADLEAYSAEINFALDFLSQIMEPESTKRLTPRKALYHPFLRDPAEPEDDEVVPHPFGFGACSEHHFVDEETDELCVRVKLEGREDWVVRRVPAGEGIAIGKEPCEFHRDPAAKQSDQSEGEGE